MGLIKKELYNFHQNTVAAAFALFGHPGRIKIILLLLIHDTLTLGQMQLELGLSQSATSDQVRRLKEAGLITGSDAETSVHYTLNKELLMQIKDLNREFWIEMEGAF